MYDFIGSPAAVYGLIEDESLLQVKGRMLAHILWFLPFLNLYRC